MTEFKRIYRNIKHQIIAMHDPISGAIALFNSYEIGFVKKYATALCKESFFKNAITGKPFPSEASKLGHCGNMPLFDSIELSLLWYTLALTGGANQINSFLQIRSEVDQALLLGKYDECLELLDKSHQAFGWSVWEIKKRISVFSERDGIDAQKQYTNGVLAKMKPGDIEYYLISCYSKQCERNVSVATYLNGIRDDYEKFLSGKLLKAMCEYARYRAYGYFSWSDDNGMVLDGDMVNWFLYFDDKRSLIDRYLSFCDIVAMLLSSGKEELTQCFIPYIVDLSSKIKDDFLSGVAFYKQNKYLKFKPVHAEEIIHIFDSYSDGQYMDCINCSSRLLLDQLTFFPLVEVYAKSCTYIQKFVPLTPQSSLLDLILQKLWKLFSRNGDINEITISLVKVLYTQLDAVWARELLSILRKNSMRLVVLEEVRINSFYSAISKPDEIFLFAPEYLNEYLANATKNYRESNAVQFAIAVRTHNTETIKKISIDPVRKKRYMAYLLLDDNPEKALSILDNIRNLSDCVAMQQEIDVMKICAELNMENLLVAMEIFVSAYYDNSNFIYIGCAEEIFQRIKSGRFDTKSSIFTPIMCGLYFNYYPRSDDRDDVVWNICYDEYLESCGVQKPSELLQAPPSNVSHMDFIRFLAEVCVPNVMDRSLAFASYDDVLEERINICAALIEYDPEFRDKYANEMERLTTNRLLFMARKKVENSKVYLDTEGIRSLYLRDICEQYERYIDFRKNGLSEFLIQFLKGPDDCNVDMLKDVLFNNPMLENIIKKMRDIFVADNKYGLDGCLSVRIRHGTLESQLRSCFEKYSLVTTKGPDGTYRSNRSWYVNLNPDEPCNVDIDNIFMKFSTAVDQVISHLKGALIQIKTENRNKDGIFDFSIDSNFVQMISARIDGLVQFDSFENMIINLFISRTEICLEQTRLLLTGYINDVFQQALKELETSLTAYKRKKIINFTGLQTQIANARTDITTELKYISEWFRLTQLNNFPDYPLSLAATLSSDLMKHSHMDCSMDINTDSIEEAIVLRGNTMQSMVEIFKILIDNIMKHSGLNGTLLAKISARREKNRLTVRMENPVKPGSINEENLKDVEHQLSDWESQGYINREGGSGLHKVKKILSVDMNCNNDVSLSCVDNVFCVRICAEMENVLL